MEFLITKYRQILIFNNFNNFSFQDILFQEFIYSCYNSIKIQKLSIHFNNFSNIHTHFNSSFWRNILIASSLLHLLHGSHGSFYTYPFEFPVRRSLKGRELPSLSSLRKKITCSREPRRELKENQRGCTPQRWCTCSFRQVGEGGG